MVSINPRLLGTEKNKRRSNLEVWSCWLQQALPEFGIVQINVPNPEALIARFERDLTIPLPRWSETNQYVSFNDCLDQLLSQPKSNSNYRQHFLRRWAEEGNVLWLYINGDKLNDAVLEDIADSLPMNTQGQYAVRILLTLDSKRLRSPGLVKLRGRLFESVESPLLHSLPDSNSVRRIVVGVIAVVSLTIGVMLVREPLLATSLNQTVSQFLISEEEPTPKVPANQQLTKQAHDTSLALLDNTTSTDASFSPSQDIDQLSVYPKALDIDASLGSVVSDDIRMTLAAAVHDWASAWESQTPVAYFSFYDDDYFNQDQSDAEQWRSWREQRITAPEWIRVEIGPVNITRDGVTYETRFWQLYRASGYQDNVQKVLTWIKRDNRWLIVDERLVDKAPAN